MGKTRVLFKKIRDTKRIFHAKMDKNKHKMVKDLNVRPETIKLLEKSRGKTLSDVNHSRIFYDPPPEKSVCKSRSNS